MVENHLPNITKIWTYCTNRVLAIPESSLLKLKEFKDLRAIWGFSSF
jgi:hypothetical protein